MMMGSRRQSGIPTLPQSPSASSLPRPSSAASTYGRATPTPKAQSFHLPDLGSTSSEPADRNVRVVLRIRPSDPDDASVPPRFRQTLVHPTSSSEVRLDVDPAALAGNVSGSLSLGSAGKRHPTFTFDQVLDESSSQVDLYDATAKEVVDDFLKGHNVTFLAYGQTSSGKSYSMGTTGDDMDYSGVNFNIRTGLIPRTVHTIFERAEEIRLASGPGASWECRLSFLELYNEEIIDLLSGAGVQVSIREERDGRIIWAGVREIKVKTLAEVMDILQAGSERRKTGSTSMNATSSRSHAIFSLTMVQKKRASSGSPSALRPETPTRLKRPSSTVGFPSARSPTPSSARGGPPSSFHTPNRPGVLPRPNSMQLSASSQDDMVVVTSKFNMVDLAGSERLKRTAAQGERMKEGISINSGLLALGNVISTLADPVKARGHIPYRDSKLTRMLQDSIGGNALTTMIACVSGIEYNIGETLNTIKYASRARNIKNSAKINQVEVGWDDVEHLQSTVLKLRKQLASINDGVAPAAPAAEEKHAEKLLARLAELQREHTDLYDRYLQKCSDNMRLTNELRNAKPGDGDSLAKFNETVEPVILEYEKVVAALNKQLDDLRLELIAVNSLYDDQSNELQDAKERFVQNETYVVELRTRLAKLTERNTSSESYIHDLEAKLKSHTDNAEVETEAVGDLKKEIAKLKESNARLETHATELEARLARSETQSSELSGIVEKHEREAEQREKSFRELESHIALLDTSKDNKALLDEMEQKDARIAELERAEDERLAVGTSSGFPSENGHSSLDHDAIAIEMSRQASHATAASSVTAVEAREVKPAGDMTPPESPGSQSVHAKEAELAALRDMLHEMSARCAAAENRCNDAEGKVADLTAQLSEAKLITAELEDRVITPMPHDDEMTTEDESTLQTPQASSPGPSPTKGSRRGSMQGNGVGVRQKDFRGGRGYEKRHRRPQSLSQELSSSQHSPVSSRASWSGPTSLLLGASPTRPVTGPLSPDRPLRSSHSLEAELKFVHKVVTERDDELRERELYIRELESRLREAHLIPSRRNSAEPPSTPQRNSPSRLPQNTPLPASPVTPTVKITDVDTAVTPATPAADSASPASNSSHTSRKYSSAEDRLAELTEIMAVKEASHREVIEQQFVQIADLQKANNKLREELAATHPELVEELEELRRDRSTLLEAKNQITTQLTSEIEDYKAQLSTLGEQTAQQVAEIERLNAEFNEEERRLDDLHEAQLQQLRTDHAQQLADAQSVTDRLLAESQSTASKAGDGHQQELRDLKHAHEAALVDLQRTHEAAILEQKDAHERASLDLRLTLETELSQLKASHEEAISRLEATHADRMSALQKESDMMVEEMEKMLNASEDTRRQLKMKADQAMFELSKIRDEHQVQRNMDAKQIGELVKLKAAQEQTISELQDVNAELQKKFDAGEHRLSRKASALPPSGPPPSMPLPPLPFSPGLSPSGPPTPKGSLGSLASPPVQPRRLPSEEGASTVERAITQLPELLGQAVQQVVDERDAAVQERDELAKQVAEGERLLQATTARVEEEEQKTAGLTKELVDTRKTNSRLRAHLEEARQDTKRAAEACQQHMDELQDRRAQMQSLSEESSKSRDSLTAANAQVLQLRAQLDKAMEMKVNKRMLKCF